MGVLGGYQVLLCGRKQYWWVMRRWCQAGYGRWRGVEEWWRGVTGRRGGRKEGGGQVFVSQVRRAFEAGQQRG